jgi:hypothetical protein
VAGRMLTDHVSLGAFRVSARSYEGNPGRSMIIQSQTALRHSRSRRGTGGPLAATFGSCW